MKDNNKYVPVDTLELGGKLICQVTYKPKTALMVVLVFGVLLLISMNPVAMGLGVFVLAIDAFVMFKVKDYKTVSLYDQYVIIHSIKDDTQVRKFTYDEIQEWNCKGSDGNGNCIMFKLDTGEVIYKDTFQYGKIYAELNKIIPDKESAAIRRERQKNVQMKFKFNFKNPFKKK